MSVCVRHHLDEVNMGFRHKNGAFHFFIEIVDFKLQAPCQQELLLKATQIDHIKVLIALNDK